VRVLCAPNTFKGTLSAASAARALAAGLRDAGALPLVLPMADGGDGTLDCLLASTARPRVVRYRVSGPLGGRAFARLGWVSQDVAVVELAEAAGMRRLGDRRDPLRSTSRGVGDLMARALDGGARRMLVGVGGSACTDGGSGLLSVLGARLIDARGRPIRRGGGALLELARADFSGLDPRLRGCAVDVAVDVANPLLGENGAAAVFAPQKGADVANVARLEAGMVRFALVLERDAGVSPALRRLPGAGAAGGSGYGLAVLGATLRPGAALVADAIGLDAALARCDLVITGEGRLDAQTAAGKAPMEVALRAARLGVPCVAIAGQVADALPAIFTAALSLTDIAGPGEDPRRVTRRLLRRAATRVVRDASAWMVR
jgi:glycerate kinase